MPQQFDQNRTASRMAAIGYPYGLPLCWQDEQSGVLRAAVLAVMDYALHRTPDLGIGQLELVRGYCQYYVHAPCWEFDGQTPELEELRERIVGVQTFSELDKWIHDCLDVGLDPL